MQLSRNARKRAKLKALAGLVAAMTALPTLAGAQSLYGCRDLLDAQIAAYEGKQGVFYRVDPDLLNYNRLSDAVVDRIGELASVLADQGTILIVVPVPTKALAMPQYLGPDAAAFGYDPTLAARIYSDTLARLTAAGAVTVDARLALRTNVAGEPVFFKTDQRLSSAGTFALARAAAERMRGGKQVNTPFMTEATGMTTLPSAERVFLQMNCSASLPEVETMGHSTTRGGAETDEDRAAVVLAGTDLTAAPALNLAGFLAELSGLAVAQHSVGSDPVAALSAYLTSDDYRQHRPEYLVWEIPVWANMAVHGDQPLREVIAAARDDCPQELIAEAAGPNILRVDLHEIEQGPEITLLLDNRSSAAPRAEFRFYNDDGQTRSRAVQRGPGDPLTGRFYMPLTGLWDEGSAFVEIETPFEPDDPPRIALCRG